MSRANVIERFPIRLPTGHDLDGAISRVPHRWTGRRVVVTPFGRDDPVLFDSGDCHDTGNALRKLDDWLTEIIALTRAVPVIAEPEDVDVATIVPGPDDTADLTPVPIYTPEQLAALTF